MYWAATTVRVRASAPPPPPVVEVAPVVQRTVPVIGEWIGTTEGYVNAQIQPQVSGYLIRQDYREGAYVKKGRVLFEIDPRPFQAALDQAKGQLAQEEAQVANADLNVKRDIPEADGSSSGELTKDFGEVDVKKGSLTMKTKLFVSILVLVSVVPGALAAGAEGETNVHTGSGQLLVTPVEDSASPNVQTDPGVLANDPKQASQDFDSILIAITEKFSGTLAAIADAIKRGELTTDQGREISAQQYQLVQMQFELVSLWREMEEQDSANIPTLQASPDLTQENEAVVVALPFSSLQLNPSMAEYLGLTPSQIDAIQQVMVREQHRLEPLMSQFRITREKFFAIGSERMSESEMKSLADREATVLGKLSVANARRQAKIYKILSPEQQEQVRDLQRTQRTGHDAR